MTQTKSCYKFDLDCDQLRFGGEAMFPYLYSRGSWSLSRTYPSICSAVGRSWPD